MADTITRICINIEPEMPSYLDGHPTFFLGRFGKLPKETITSTSPWNPYAEAATYECHG